MRRFVCCLLMIGACSERNVGYSPAADLAGLRSPTDGAPMSSPLLDLAGDGATDMALAQSGDMVTPALDLTPARDLAPACLGQCQPGDKQISGDGCGERSCNPDCTWGGWTLKGGNACFTGTTRSCNAGIDCPHDGTQACVACNWGACTC